MIRLEELDQAFGKLPFAVCAGTASCKLIYSNAAYDRLAGGQDYYRAFDDNRTRQRGPVRGVPPIATGDMIAVEQLTASVFVLSRTIPFRMPDGSRGLVTIFLASADSREAITRKQAHYEHLITEVRDDLAAIREHAATKTLSPEDFQAIAELRRLTRIRHARLETASDGHHRLH